MIISQSAAGRVRPGGYRPGTHASGRSGVFLPDYPASPLLHGAGRLKRKLLIIEERTGGEGADYLIRTLQSRQS